MPAKLIPDLLGQRMTSQRRILLDIIRNAGEHLDADELFRQAKDKDPHISLSTVYRNLQLFKEAGLVTERHFVEDHHHYETADAAEHYHIICCGCGKVVEFQSPMNERMRKDVERQSEFTITDIEVSMQGYCPKCREINKK